MNKECNIVQDLIPLYVEKTASKESADFVEKHCATCDECKKVLELSKNLIIKNEKEQDEKMQKIWANIENQEKKQKIRKRITVITCAFIAIIFIITSYTLTSTGITIFANVDYNSASSYPTSGKRINFSKENPPGKYDVVEAANEVKKLFTDKFGGCVLLELFYEEDMTFDKDWGNGKEIVFSSTWYTITGSPSREAGETVSYWNWYVKYDFTENKWVIENYGYA